MKGWVVVVVGGAGTDWIGLSLLVEEAWRSVAPPRLLRGEVVQTPPSPPARSPRVTTDAATAQRALERPTTICLRLPEAGREKESRHATFRVRKMRVDRPRVDWKGEVADRVLESYCAVAPKALVKLTGRT